MYHMCYVGVVGAGLLSTAIYSFRGYSQIAKPTIPQISSDQQSALLTLSRHNRIPLPFALAQSDLIAGFNRQTRTMDGWTERKNVPH